MPSTVPWASELSKGVLNSVLVCEVQYPSQLVYLRQQYWADSIISRIFCILYDYFVLIEVI